MTLVLLALCSDQLREEISGRVIAFSILDSMLLKGCPPPMKAFTLETLEGSVQHLLTYHWSCE